MKKIGILIFGLSYSATAFSQNTWDADEIITIFDGIDVTAALERVEAKGITPYDFGRDLLVAGEGEKAKQWYQALTIATKDPQYIYGLAWVKWQTGDNGAALKDAQYLLHKNPSPLIRARTLFLLGGINVDERQFERARERLTEGLKAYTSLNKFGGQFLCLSMLAMVAVHEREFDEVEPLLDRAYEINEKMRTKGFKPYSRGRYHEIIGEMRFVQGDYIGAASSAEESEAAYRQIGQTDLADEILAKTALLKVLNGEPKSGGELATELWQRFHESIDRGRLLAYNNITLMKLSQCANIEEDREAREVAARKWASSAPGGKALLELLEFVKKFPCSEWR